MSEMPLLGRARARPRRRLAIVLLFLAIASLVVWRLWVAFRTPPAPRPAPVASAEPVVPTTAETPDASTAPPVVEDAVRRAGMRYVRAIVSGPLETAIVKAVGRELGAALTQVLTRTLVWWISVPGDLRSGDVVELLLSEQSGAEPIVHAVRFQSKKLARTFEAYRFQPPGAPFPRTFTRDGQELELRLEQSPLDDYEQVTSLLRDGRGHKGVDFRAPVGTPVKATFDAVIVRKNWNFSANGNCLEMREQGGNRHTAIFLHLAELPHDIKVGDHVSRGQVIAKSGNTGHSFAPHLHYQLETSSGALLDPFVAQSTKRRALGAPQRALFDAEVKRLDGLLASGAEASK